jgi:uncharacterized protein YqeY
MTLYEQVSQDLKEAMKTKDAFRRDTLRLLQSALKNEAIEKRVSPEALSDEEVLAVVKRLVKQRRDSIEQYQSGGRMDLAEKEQSELALLSGYLPESLPAAELERIVREALEAGGFSEKAQFGAAMGAAMRAVSGRAGGDEVKAAVERILL